METLVQQEQQTQYNLAAAHEQAQALLAHGSAEGMAAMADELMVNSGNITFAPEDIAATEPAAHAEEKLRLAMGVSTLAQEYGLTADTTPNDLKGLYVKLWDDALAYKPEAEGYSPDVARAKSVLAVAAYRRMETPVASAASN
ncbi:MAG TPA: hypothetical protein VGO07_02925 [Candidatus Saccharimonadales bacterium]|nr:hypothetical protein [Candidatus Saccharimonadales bacterium]